MSHTGVSTLQVVYDGITDIVRGVGLRKSPHILTPKESPGTTLDRSYSVHMPRSTEKPLETRAGPSGSMTWLHRVQIALVHQINPKDHEITQRKAFEDEQNIILHMMADLAGPMCPVEIDGIPEIKREVDAKAEWWYTTMTWDIRFEFDLSQDVVVEDAR